MPRGRGAEGTAEWESPVQPKKPAATAMAKSNKDPLHSASTRRTTDNASSIKLNDFIVEPLLRPITSN